MSQRITPLVSDEYFHIYNRGNNKQKIFLDDEDKKRFVKLLYISNSKRRIKFRDNIVDLKIDAFELERGEPIVSIGAWVLMPNHFHLYVVSPTPGVGEELNRISLFMNKLCTSYSKYFNNKYARTGSLFEGRFKAVHVANDIQAKYLFSYIHLNPIKLIKKDWKENGISDISEVLDFLKQYRWSSYLDYLGISRMENKILNKNNFPNYFSNILDFNKEILEWLKLEDK